MHQCFPHDPAAEAAFHLLRRLHPHSPAPLRIIPEGRHGLPQGLFIPRRDQQAVHTVLHNLVTPAYIRGNGGQFHGPRLKEGIGESLPVAGQHEHVRRLQPGPDILLKTGTEHTGHVQIHPGAILRPSHQRQKNGRSFRLRAQSGKRGKQFTDALVFRNPETEELLRIVPF